MGFVRIAAVFILLFFSLKSPAQLHDFDSLINANSAFAEIARTIGDTLDLFNDSEVLELKLETDFKNLVKRKMKEEYQPATFSAMFNDTVRVNRTIKIRARGINRKNTCLIPPLKLNFPKKDAFIKQLSYFDKMKMVLDCKRGNIYEQYLLSEYYAYKILNVITDFSLRVRLVRATYIDTSGKFKDVTKYAFFIEHIKQLAERHNAERLEKEGVRDVRTNLAALVDGYLFQYLIGNTDWSIPGNHNVYFIKSKDKQIPFPYVIPYDFDYAGIVDALYAIPNEELRLESVRERLYRGRCIPEEELWAGRERILAVKDQIYQIYEDDELMNKSNKSKTVRYIDEFFAKIEREGVFQREIIGGCR